MSEAQIFRDGESDLAHRARRVSARTVMYLILIAWAVICLFPIYWTITTSFKTAPDVMQGNLVPWAGFAPDWLGWRSLGLSPERLGEPSTVRDQFMLRFTNSAIVSFGASGLALVLGTLGAYGLSRFSFRFGVLRNQDMLFFFISQLILPPVVLALPFLVLYRELALLDTRIGLILLYTLTVMPIVMWIMRDQFRSLPVELEEAALVDGLSIWGAFLTIVVPLALPGMVASFILSLVLTWNEYFFASLLTSTDSVTLPVMVASQTGSQGINWWAMAALSTASIAPLLLVGILLERYIVAGMATGAVKE